MPDTLIPVLSDSSEQRIRSALDRMAGLVLEGEAPTPALAKVAAESGLPPGHYPLLAQVFNISRAEGQRQENSDVLGRAEVFPLADSAEALALNYPAQFKTAAEQRRASCVAPVYQRPPTPQQPGPTVEQRLAPLLAENVKLAAARVASATTPEQQVSQLEKRLDAVQWRQCCFEEKRAACSTALDQLHLSVAELLGTLESRPVAELPDILKYADYCYGEAGSGLLQRCVAMSPILQKRAAPILGAPPITLRHDGTGQTAPAIALRQEGVLQQPGITLQREGTGQAAPAVIPRHEGVLQQPPPIALRQQGTGQSAPPIALRHEGVLQDQPPAANSLSRILSRLAVPGGVRRPGQVAPAAWEPAAARAPFPKAGSALGIRPASEIANALQSIFQQVDAYHSLAAWQEKAAADLTAAQAATGLQPLVPPTYCDVLGQAVEKQGSALGLFSAAAGSAAGRELAGRLPLSQPIGELRTRELEKLTDPEHDTELRRAQVSSMLNNFLTDDDVIKGHDPREVLEHFNGIAQIVPHGANQTEIMRSLLRKRLTQGAVDPFDLEMMLRIENGLKKRDDQVSNGVLDDDERGVL